MLCPSSSFRGATEGVPWHPPVSKPLGCTEDQTAPSGRQTLHGSARLAGATLNITERKQVSGHLSSVMVTLLGAMLIGREGVPGSPEPSLPTPPFRSASSSAFPRGSRAHWAAAAVLFQPPRLSLSSNPPFFVRGGAGGGDI